MRKWMPWFILVIAQCAYLPVGLAQAPDQCTTIALEEGNVWYAPVEIVGYTFRRVSHVHGDLLLQYADGFSWLDIVYLPTAGIVYQHHTQARVIHMGSASSTPGTFVYCPPLLEPTATSTPTASMPTATSSPTAIAAVELGMSAILTTTGQLAQDQVAAWSPTAPTGPLFLSLAMLLAVFGLLAFIRRMP